MLGPDWPNFIKMKAGNGRIICKINISDKYDTLISSVKDPEGKVVDLHADPSWHEEAFFNCQLEVIGVPDKMSDSQDLATRHYKSAIEATTCDHIQERIHIGDIAVVHYLNVDSSNIQYINGEFMVVVPYRDVICYIDKQGDIKMVGGHILLEQKDQIKDYSSAIIIPDKQVLNITYTVMHIGLPLRGHDTLEVAAGDEVTLSADFGQYKVGDRKYVVSMQHHISSIFVSSSK